MGIYFKPNFREIAMKNLLLPTLLLGSITLTACQSTPTAPVILRADNTYENTGVGKTKIVAQQNAIANANKQCGLQRPVILTDSVKYNGVLDESIGRAADKATKAITGIFGRSTSLASDDDYEYTITFRCQ